MASEKKSSIESQIQVPIQFHSQNLPSQPDSKSNKSKPSKKSKSRSKKSKPELPPHPAPTPTTRIIYVPVVIKTVASAAGTSTSGTVVTGTGRSGKAVLTEQQMIEWRCQADGCTAQAATAGRYYLRHRICDEHSKAPSVLVTGIQQRYCQQCSRFHELSEFDGSRRSCRRQLCRRRLLRSLNTLSNEEDLI